MRRARGGSTRLTSTSRLNTSLESGASSPGIVSETQPLFPPVAKVHPIFSDVSEGHLAPPGGVAATRGSTSPRFAAPQDPPSAIASTLLSFTTAAKGAKLTDAALPSLRNRDVFPREAKAYILNPKVRAVKIASVAAVRSRASTRRGSDASAVLCTIEACYWQCLCW